VSVQELFSSNPLRAEKPRIAKHKQFYIPEGNMVLLVEQTLFKVDMDVLHSHSPVFKDYVAPSLPGQTTYAAYTNKRPLVLRGVTVSGFAFLLSMLYSYENDVESVNGPSTVEEYLEVLKLATGFRMQTIRDTVTRELCELYIDPIRKIAIWDEFQLEHELVLSAYAELCQQDDPLTLSMSMSLGLRNFTKLAACREIYRDRLGCSSHRQSSPFEESPDIADEIIWDAFAKRKSTVIGSMYIT